MYMRINFCLKYKNRLYISQISFELIYEWVLWRFSDMLVIYWNKGSASFLFIELLDTFIIISYVYLFLLDTFIIIVKKFSLSYNLFNITRLLPSKLAIKSRRSMTSVTDLFLLFLNSQWVPKYSIGLEINTIFRKNSRVTLVLLALISF